MAYVARLYRKAGPNEALVVFGFRGTRIVKGHGTVVVPLLEDCKALSLELMSFDVAPKQELYTRQGVAITVEAVSQIKVRSDIDTIRIAAEQLLTKPAKEREALIRLVMEGHLRGIMGQLAVEEIVKQPEMVSERMRSTCAHDMNKMGLEVVSFTIKEVRDRNEYIVNMGRPDIARIRRDADVAAAEAERDTAIRRANARREAAVATALAEQERVHAETLSLTKQSEAQRDLEIKRAEFNEGVQRQKAHADNAYEIQTSVMQQQLTAEKMKVLQVEKQGQVRLQETEIARREHELIATVLKQAEIEHKRIETLAMAERSRLTIEAEGKAAAITQQGEAEAGVVFKKGEAEARAMNVKADAFRQYNQAAVIDRFVTAMPEIVRALASPLANVDRITVVATGDGQGTGLDRVTADIAKMVAQVPALFHTLTGVQLAELLRKVPELGAGPREEQPGAAE
jgi:flotillin